MSHIVAIGGAGFESGTPDLALYRYLVDLTGKSRPHVAFLPQASGESRGYVIGFQQVFENLGCRTSWLSLFAPHTAAIRDFLLEQDLVYVGGGNTKSMLALWREWGVDRFLREAGQNGTVLAGLSAGSICWFEQGTTDSIPGELTALACLGYLAGSFCPHYDSEPLRRPTYGRMVGSGEIQPGYAADDGVGLHFVGGEHKLTISGRASGGAYRLEKGDAGAIESALPVFRAGN